MRKKRHQPNPYLDDGPPRHGTKSERRIAKEVGGRETIGSGNLEFQKGDSYFTAKPAEIEINFMLESKATIHQSISLKKAWLDKVYLDARNKNMTPGLTLSFVDESGNPQDLTSEYVVIPMSVFRELTGGSDG